MRVTDTIPLLCSQYWPGVPSQLVLPSGWYYFSGALLETLADQAFLHSGEIARRCCNTTQLVLGSLLFRTGGIVGAAVLLLRNLVGMVPGRVAKRVLTWLSSMIGVAGACLQEWCTNLIEVATTSREPPPPRRNESAQQPRRSGGFMRSGDRRTTRGGFG